MTALNGWTLTDFTADGVTHPIYRKGEGPGVIVIHEIPGITPRCRPSPRKSWRRATPS